MRAKESIDVQCETVIQDALPSACEMLKAHRVVAPFGYGITLSGRPTLISNIAPQGEKSIWHWLDGLFSLSVQRFEWGRYVAVVTVRSIETRQVEPRGFAIEFSITLRGGVERKVVYPYDTSKGGVVLGAPYSLISNAESREGSGRYAGKGFGAGVAVLGGFLLSVIVWRTGVTPFIACDSCKNVQELSDLPFLLYSNFWGFCVGVITFLFALASGVGIMFWGASVLFTLLGSAVRRRWS